MSTRKRIARATTVSLVVLSMSSIVSAGAFAAHVLEPTPAVAGTRVAEQGVLGVGSETSAPLAKAVSPAEKVRIEPSVLATTALVVPAAKKAAAVPKTAKAKRATARKASAEKRANARAARSAKHKATRAKNAAILKKLGKGWRRARVSWYGPGFYGNTMAGGGKLTRTSMVVAHRSMPFGTKIQFVYRGRSCVATVRDRGPYISGRTFDLGPGVAKALGFGGVGVVQYRILGR